MSRILVDNNLSLLVKDVLQTDFPESDHVYEIGMAEASDTQIWEFAKKKFDALITKDKDFYYRVVLHGSPPKIIWITSGNMRNRGLVDLIRLEKENIRTFLMSKNDILSSSEFIQNKKTAAKEKRLVRDPLSIRNLFVFGFISKRLEIGYCKWFEEDPVS